MNTNVIRYYFKILNVAFRRKRLMNAFKLSVSYGLSRWGILPKWDCKPQFISIEPVNICNLRCPECPVGTRLQPKAVYMDMTVGKKLLDELQPTLMHAILYFQGEPLISKNFAELVRYAHARNVLTSTSTNGQLLDSDTAKALVASGLDRLIISIDGTTQETYETYRVGGKLEKALQGVRWMVAWRKRLKSASPLIEIQFLVLRTNEHQLDDMRQLAKELQADRLTFKTAQLYDFEHGNPLLPENEKYARYARQPDGTFRIKSPLRNRCKRLWKGAVVTSTGDVLPCRFDKNSAFAFGNVTSGSFGASWNGEKADRFRRQILENRKQVEMCRNCTEK